MPTIQENKDVAQRYFDEVINSGNLGAIDGLVTENYVSHDPVTPVAGRQQLRDLHSRTYRPAFPDMHVSAEQIIGEGDTVVVRWRGNATHHGSFTGVSETHRGVTVEGVFIWRFENGKIAETWSYWDRSGQLKQLGAIEHQ